MEKVGLNITQKELKQLSKWAENVYNTVVVIDYFVASQPEIEECYNLAPVVKHLRSDADLLNAFFIDHEEELENKAVFNSYSNTVQKVFKFCFTITFCNHFYFIKGKFF